MSYNYTNLVFEGGGVKCIAYAGAIQVLSDLSIMPQITQVAGTSAGAITATMVALGYTSEEITNIIMNVDFTKFEDDYDPVLLPIYYGLYRGKYFLDWMKGLITDKVKNPDITFADLYTQTQKGLYVFATDLNMYNVKQFSHIDTPNVPVAEAVRASMSIPLVFDAWKFTKGNPDHQIYVDGGVVLNYPLTVFDSGYDPYNPKTLGFYLVDLFHVKKPNTLAYGEPVRYCKVLFETILDAQDIDFSKDESMLKRTVQINDFGIAATDFDITPEQRQELFDAGVQATKSFLGVQVLTA
jgi:NTE family protein